MPFTIMFYFCYSLFLLFPIISSAGHSSITTTAQSRIGKFFPLWGVGLVRIENGVCVGADGLEGTCFSRRQCRDESGIGSGVCASGLAVCCIIQQTCGDTISTNTTYFVSPNFPKQYAGSGICSATVQKLTSDICQIRIDFLAFTLSQPTGNGSCVSDAFYVTGASSRTPVICGENSGQHIYVDFNNDNDIQLLLNTQTATAWNFKITQIGCSCPTRAPTGCLQYYPGLSGTVRSFNYGSTGSQLGTRQLANENYGICVQMQPGYCSIRWTQSSGDLYSFTLTGDTFTSLGTGQINTPMAALKGLNCTTDFIVISNPTYTNGTRVNSDRFCGNGFIPITTASKPFGLTVVTDGNDVNDTGNRGFSLAYTQQRCLGAILG